MKSTVDFTPMISIKLNFAIEIKVNNKTIIQSLRLKCRKFDEKKKCMRF